MLILTLSMRMVGMGRAGFFQIIGTDELRAYCTSTLFDGIDVDNALPILVRQTQSCRISLARIAPPWRREFLRRRVQEVTYRFIRPCVLPLERDNENKSSVFAGNGLMLGALNRGTVNEMPLL